MKNRKRLGDILIDLGMLTTEDLQRCLEIQKKTNQRLGKILLEEKYVTNEQMEAIFEYQFGVKFVDLRKIEVDKTAVNVITQAVALRHMVLPIAFRGEKLVVAMEDPLDLIARDDLRLITGHEIQVVMSNENLIRSYIDRYYEEAGEKVETVYEELSEESELEQETAFVEVENEQVANSPVVRMVNTIIKRAIKTRTSDIHIEPFEHEIRIRYRIDGDLREETKLPKNVANALVTRIKILGGMDISEKRVPQDGRIETELDGKKVDLRISILPTVHGEKIVIRILDRNSILMTKEQIGFTAHNIELFEKIIKASEGIILLTGPTGSGKTTTLYAVLRELNKIKSNIITAEDPVEYRLDGVNQVQINNKAGLTFAATLRSMLRQDPDVIMVGEMRDAETAEIATRAAITGHVVLSTLHTNDTASTISRLVDMGIEPFMVSTSLVGIIAQRLVKKICVRCKEKKQATDAELEALKVKTPLELYKGKGCSECNGSGYRGRIAIHEILVMNKQLKSMVTRSETTEKIKQCAIDTAGLETLSESCRQLVLQGVTTVEEMLRVAYSVED